MPCGVKPRHTVGFVVDAYNRILGITAAIPGVAQPVQQGTWVDPASLPNLLPRDKFLLYSFRPKHGDPRGSSILRPAYNPWNLKQQAVREWLRYITQFASPSLVGEVAPTAIPEAPTDSLGNPQLDTNGIPLPAISPQVSMANQLAAFRNGSALAIASGAKVTALFSSGDGKAFIEFVDYCDRQITKDVLGQTLASEEAKHQSRAARRRASGHPRYADPAGQVEL